MIKKKNKRKGKRETNACAGIKQNNTISDYWNTYKVYHMHFYQYKKNVFSLLPILI